jgi:predicted HTH transcriptional regulator
MSWKDIIECLRYGESETVEFIKTVASTEELASIIVSMLNHKGGQVIIGVDDKNDHLNGSNVSKQFIQTAIEKIDPDPRFDIEEINRLSKTIFLISLTPPFTKPYHYRNKYYFRTEDQSRKVTKDELYKLVGIEKEEKTNKRQKKTISYLQKNPNISNMIYRELFKVSHKTAHLELTDLVQKSFIIKTGQGRNTAYQLK